MADGSETTIGAIVEATAGTTPATPVFRNMRITNETLTANFETLVSNELRADASVSDVRRSGLTVSGDINFELHKGAIFEDVLAAALRGTWATNTLKTGVLKPSWTFERKIIGSAATAYLRFAGSRIGGLSLTFDPGEIITGSFKVTGTAHTAATSIITGATYTAPSTTPVMAGIDVTSLAVSGVAGVDFLSMTMELDNALRIQRKLGQVAARGVGYGRRQITGTLVCYFEDLTAYNAFLTDATPSIIATCTDGTNTFTITVPKIRITGGEVPSPGNDTDIMLTLNWQAVYDGTATCDLQIVRSAAGV